MGSTHQRASTIQRRGAGRPEWSLLGAAIGRLITARRDGSDVVPVGRTDTYRDFVAVDDVVDAVLKVAESDLAPGVVNVCSGTPTRVGDVLAILAGVWGVPSPGGAILASSGRMTSSHASVILHMRVIASGFRRVSR